MKCLQYGCEYNEDGNCYIDMPNYLNGEIEFCYYYIEILGLE